jgi:DNA-directed RNA polymerase specialized sigma24 family protein
MLAARYIESRCDETFNALYYELLPTWERRWRNDVRSLGDDICEIRALYQDALLNVLDAWDSSKGNFEHMLNRRIKQRKIDLFRKRCRRGNLESSLEEMTEESEGKAATLTLEDTSCNVEDEVTKKMIESGRQPIIDHLLQSGQIDNVTTAIVTNYSRYDSENALGKALGIHHETVKRKLLALGRRYDASRFGDIRDYYSA